MIDISVLPQKTSEIFELLSHVDFISHFYLTGGTGLALQLKHRESEDLDFFTQREFNPESLQTEALKLGKLTNVMLDKGTLNCFVKGVKLQFLHYPYTMLEKPITYRNLSISSRIDIACTKLITISDRGYKKDFIDLYFLLQKYTLTQLFNALRKKYDNVNYNEAHILKSLLYFEEADEQPMPRLLIPVTWSEVKKYITDVTKKSNIV